MEIGRQDMRWYVVLRRNLHQDAHRMWRVLDGVKDLVIRFLDAAEEDIHSLETKHGLEAGSAPYRPALESCSGTNDLSVALLLSLPFTGLGAKGYHDVGCRALGEHFVPIFPRRAVVFAVHPWHRGRSPHLLA